MYDHIYDLALTSGLWMPSNSTRIFCILPAVCALVPDGHPLYGKPLIRLDDLRPYHLMLISRQFLNLPFISANAAASTALSR